MSTINGDNGKKAFQRLPKDVVPLLYKISLKPDLVKFVFAGSESINVKVVNQTSQIVLNAKDIEIIEATFEQNGETIKGSVGIDQETDKAFIQFNQQLKIGDGQLNLVFNGILNDKMAGFYRCQYKCSTTGEERYSGTTQFEATDARRAFPCWDEPAIKARFEVTIIAPKDRVVLSNTNIAKESDHPDEANLKIVQFEPTPIMSTYLVAWVVGEYESVESKTARGVKVKVYTPIGKKNQGSFALDDAVRFIEYFEDYFKVPYPLEKLDHISIPDFAFNAMENWGLVTYRESCLLVDPENTSFSAKQNTSRVIAHETAHQWFGNLVTMEWWTHLWLNEGFATFMQYLAVEAHHPEFEFWNQFCVESSIEALELDASHRSHAIEIPVNAPEEISSIFDHISYHKGASVIRMCHSWIGDEAFRNGMKDYLTEHAYKNATTKDLWRALEKSSKKPVEDMMSTWTGQMGYPLINVEMTSQGSKMVLKLTQEKFTVDGKLMESEEKILWMVPIAVVTSANPQHPVKFDLLTSKFVEVTLDNLSSDGWIKLNPSMFGFYRVNYPVHIWKQLAEGIKNKTLSPLDRLQIIDDLLALNLAGKIHVSILLDVLGAYADEDDYVPWNGVDRCLARLGSLLSYTDLQNDFQHFARKLVLNVYHKIGLEKQPEEPNTRSLMRSLVLSRLVSLRDEGALAEAKKKFELHRNNQLMDPDLRSAVYRSIASTGDDAAYETLYKLYYDTELQEEKLRIATALGSTHDDHKIERALKFAFSEHVRSQNAWQVIIAVSVTPKGRDSAWKFYKENIREVKERYGSHRSSSVLIQKLTENFASNEMAQEVSDFFIKNPFPGLEDVVCRAVEKIRVNAQWLKREVTPLKEYLTAKNG